MSKYFSVHNFVKYAPAAIAMFDREMKFIAASQKWYQDYGITDEIIGKELYEVFPHFPTEWKKIHKWCMQGHSEHREEDSYVDQQSRTQWIKWEVQPWYRDDNGDIGGIIMFTENITNRKQSEKELLKRNKELEKLKRATLNILEDVEEEKNRASQEKEKLSLILQSIGDGVVVMDEEQKILLTNPITTELSGYTSEELIGNHYYELLKFVDKDEKPFTAFIDKVYAEGIVTSLDNDISLVRKDGKRIAVADSAAPIKVDGKVTGCIVIFRDATKERRIDQMKSDFVSIASHQLRTPLTAVKWYTELLAGEFDDGDSKLELINEIATSNERMIMLVNDLLSVSRIEREHNLELEYSDIDLRKLVENVTKENSALIRAQQVSIDNKVPENLLLRADKDKIFEVFKNLINNAVKYSTKGKSVEVTAENLGQKIKINVIDHGIGIPDSQQNKIFHKFFRADNAAKLQTEGNGLGLYIVKSYTEVHNGQVWFESELNKGTTFTVILPNIAKS